MFCLLCTCTVHRLFADAHFASQVLGVMTRSRQALALPRTPKTRITGIVSESTSDLPAIRVGDPSRPEGGSRGTPSLPRKSSAATLCQAMTTAVVRVLSGLYDRVLRAADEQQWSCFVLSFNDSLFRLADEQQWARVVEQRQKEQGSSGAGKKADKLWDVVLQVRAA